MKVTGARAGVPASPNPYPCFFAGVEETNHPHYGPGLKWIFEVADGDFKGQKIYRGTAPRPTQGNSCGKFMGMLASESVLAEGVSRDTDSFLSKNYDVWVQNTPEGTSTRIEKFALTDDVPF